MRWGARQRQREYFWSEEMMRNWTIIRGILLRLEQAGDERDHRAQRERLEWV